MLFNVSLNIFINVNFIHVIDLDIVVEFAPRKPRSQSTPRCQIICYQSGFLNDLVCFNTSDVE